MFDVKSTVIDVLGEKIEVRPLSATKMLAYRSKHKALAEDDLDGVIKLMRDLVIDCSIKPKVMDSDLDPLDMESLKKIFHEVAIVCGIADKSAEDARGNG